MRIADSILMELDQEAATTRRVLERVPGDKLAWKPHSKSMSLGQLALHVATTPGQVAELAAATDPPMPRFSGGPPAAESSAQLVPALEQSVARAKELVGRMDDATIMAPWRLTRDGKAMLEMPRIGVLRAIMLNHWYHHRGQLSVYLRLLDVPVPSIYGPSADENPFG